MSLTFKPFKRSKNNIHGDIYLSFWNTALFMFQSLTVYNKWNLIACKISSHNILEIEYVHIIYSNFAVQILEAVCCIHLLPWIICKLVKANILSLWLFYFAPSSGGVSANRTCVYDKFSLTPFKVSLSFQVSTTISLVNQNNWLFKIFWPLLGHISNSMNHIYCVCS